MRSLLVIGSLVLASCSKEGGVEVIVKPTDDTARIALFVGKGAPIVQNIAPDATVAPYFNTQSWLRDPNNDLSQVEGVAGQAVSFGLVGPSDPLSIIIAVGFNGSGVVTSAAVLPEQLRPVTVPDHAVSRYTLDLQPVSSIDQTSPLEVHVWEPTDPAAPGDPGRCALVLDKPSGKKVAVVSDNDQDCDGWPAGDPKECVKQSFMSGHAPKLDASIHCALPTSYTTTSGTMVGAAVLGGDKCKDGTGVIAGCEKSNYCLDRYVYAACGGDYACIQDITTSTTGGQVPQFHCSISTDGAGHLCEDPLPLIGNVQGLALSHSCKPDSARITAPGSPWDDRITRNVGTPTTPVTLTIALGADCRALITPKGATFGDGIELGALVAADLDNGRGFAIPVTFSVDAAAAGCGQPRPCSLNNYMPDGSLGACVDSPLEAP